MKHQAVDRVRFSNHILNYSQKVDLELVLIRKAWVVETLLTEYHT